MLWPTSANARIERALPTLKAIVEGDFNQRIAGITGDDATAELLHLVNDLVDRCDAYMRESANCMQATSRNAYYREIIETGMQGDFLTASRSVNAALGTMRERVARFADVTDSFERSVGGVVETVATAAADLRSSSTSMREIAADTSARTTSVAAAADQAAANVQTVATASEELSASIGEINHQISCAV